MPFIGAFEIWIIDKISYIRLLRIELCQISTKL